MPIEASLVKWDETPQINEKLIKWDAAPDKQSYDVADIPGAALSNLPKSAGNFIGGMAHMVAHPIDTVKNTLDAAAGGLKNITPKPIADFIDSLDSNPEAANKAVATANAVGGIYKDRYGSVDALKRTVAEDPVGAVSDLSTILSAGSAITSKIPSVSNALATGAKYTNPLNLIPAAVSKAGELMSPQLEKGATHLMGSALKPTLKQWKNGDANTAIQTMLDEGLNVTRGGVEKLKDKIGYVNDEISSKIQPSTAVIDKQAVLNALNDTKKKFTNQVSPTSDLNAIDNVAADFTNHPTATGTQIPVQLAQELKQGTYKVLSNKYGQMGSAETEAQKALAWGLKEGVANAVPDIAGLNARESALIKTLDVTERRALMDINKNPMGLALLAHNPTRFAEFMADKSGLFKSLAARMLNQASKPNKLADLVKGVTPEQTRLPLLLKQTQPEQQ